VQGHLTRRIELDPSIGIPADWTIALQAAGGLDVSIEGIAEADLPRAHVTVRGAGGAIAWEGPGARERGGQFVTLPPGEYSVEGTIDGRTLGTPQAVRVEKGGIATVTLRDPAAGPKGR